MTSNRIRKLTPSEMALVCGGSDMGTVTVTPDYDDWHDPSWYDPDYGDVGHIDNGGGGGGGSDPLDQYTTTNLSADVDAIVNKSPTLEGLVQLAQAKGFTIASTNDYSRTDYTAKVIYVKEYSSANSTASQLVHELGHTLFDGEWNSVTTKAAAVNMGLATEGEATLYSIAAQRELAAQGVSMTLAANPGNFSTYNSIYDSYMAGNTSWDSAAAQIGEIYRYGEKVDVNGTLSTADDKTYEQYYSDWWDSKHPGGN